jgi:flagellar biosynthesis protein FlhF
MRLKVFQAATVAEAMAEIRRTLGEDAVIVATETAPDGARVTAATDSTVPFDAMLCDEAAGDVPDMADVLYERLDRHRVPAPLIERLVGAALTIGGDNVVSTLGGILQSAFAFHPLQSDRTPRRVLLIGPPGQGKTVTAARLTARAVLAGRPVRVIAADMTRAGAFAQISELCRPMGVKPLPWSPQAPLDAGDGLVVIDGPGVNPFDAADLANVSEIVAATDAEPLLVLAAGTEATEAAEIADAFAAVGVQRLIATRLDAARRLGGVLAAADAGLALADAGIGRAIAETLVAFQPLALARLLLSDSPTDIIACAKHEEAA